MLRPAILYRNELLKLFSEELYTEKYYYYTGYAHSHELPNIEVRDNYYQWAIVKGTNVIGYLAYHVDVATDTVNRFGLYSFDKGNLTVAKDVYDKLVELVRTYHRVEWRVIEGNHAKRGYDSFCKKLGGNCVCLHDVTTDLNGNYRNEYIYEIVTENKLLRNRGF